MLLNRTVAPASQIVELQDAKDHLRVDDMAGEDFYISGLISAASGAIEEMTGRSVVAQTWEMSLPYVAGKVYLPKSPVQSVSTISYYDAGNASQTLTVSDYYLFKDQDRAWLEPKPNVVWPTTYSRADAVTITFVAGYSTVPQELKQAALLLIEHWYEHRGATEGGAEMPYAVQSLVGLHKIGWVGA